MNGPCPLRGGTGHSPCRGELLVTRTVGKTVFRWFDSNSRCLFKSSYDERQITVRVTMQHSISGLRDGAFWPAIGESIDVPDDEAADLIRAGIAVDPDAEPDDEDEDAEADTGDVPPPVALTKPVQGA